MVEAVEGLRFEQVVVEEKDSIGANNMPCSAAVSVLIIEPETLTTDARVIKKLMTIISMLLLLSMLTFPGSIGFFFQFFHLIMDSL